MAPVNIKSDGCGGLMGHGITSSTPAQNEGFGPVNGMAYGDRYNTLRTSGNMEPHNNIPPAYGVYRFRRTT